MQDLLETTGMQHPCDLDLLVFFHRHPRVGFSPRLRSPRSIGKSRDRC
jgi:hypothetical protein